MASLPVPHAVSDPALAYPPDPDSWKYDDSGRPKLSGKQIEAIAIGLLAKYAPECLREPRAIPTDVILNGVRAETGVDLAFEDLPHGPDVDLRGVTIFSRGLIVLDKSLADDPKRNPYLRFTLAHELGHWILQRHRPIRLVPEEDAADEVVDSIHQLSSTRRPPFQTVEDWVEWQANHFATHLVLPRRPLRIAVVQVNLEAGININRAHNIYFNASPEGQADASRRISRIADIFGVSPRQVINALEDSSLIERQEVEPSAAPWGPVKFFPESPY